VFQEDDFKTKHKSKKFNKKIKPKIKMRDRFGKALKNKNLERESIERFNEEYLELEE